MDSTSSKQIRFINTRYEELFRVPDGEQILITHQNGDWQDYRICKYIDEYHMELIDAEQPQYTNIFHIEQFAEITEKDERTIYPLEPLENITDILQDMTDSQLVHIYNESKDREENEYPEYIYDMEYFNDYQSHRDENEIKDKLRQGNFKQTDKYFYTAEGEKLYSFSKLEDLTCPISREFNPNKIVYQTEIDQYAEEACKYNHDFKNEQIRQAMKGYYKSENTINKEKEHGEEL